MKERKLNIDVIKCIASFFVICVHFFLYSGYYDQSFKNRSILISSFIWIIFMTCVPLFIITTGYLMKDKTYSRSYFLKLLPVLGIYSLSAAIYTYFDVGSLKVDYFGRLLENIFTFSHYAWYVNMYIGLYLMIPFLNVGFKSLKNRWNQCIFLLVLIVLSSLSSTLSLLFGKSHTFGLLVHLIPDYWKGIWPITYYLIGVYMTSIENKLNLKKVFFSFLLIDVFTVIGLVTLLKNSIGIEFNFLSILILSTLLFYILLNLQISGNIIWISKIILFVSKNTLPIYLLSVIGDTYWYPRILAKWDNFSHILSLFPLIVLFLFLQSTVLTYFLTRGLTFTQSILIKLSSLRGKKIL